MNILKKLANNAIKSPRTTIGGVLALVGLFTPLSPAIIAGGAAVGLILGASDPKHEDK